MWRGSCPAPGHRPWGRHGIRQRAFQIQVQTHPTSSSCTGGATALGLQSRSSSSSKASEHPPLKETIPVHIERKDLHIILPLHCIACIMAFKKRWSFRCWQQTRSFLQKISLFFFLNNFAFQKMNLHPCRLNVCHNLIKVILMTFIATWQNQYTHSNKENM